LHINQDFDYISFMEIVAKFLIGIIALMHFYFLWLEMFAWTTRGVKVFKGTKEFHQQTKSMAANQGLYNGFLAAGLVWSLLITDHAWSIYVAIFFLGCVLVAGLFGAVTVDKKIFYIQGLPALIAIILLHF
jgi:putative membrane protein